MRPLLKLGIIVLGALVLLTVLMTTPLHAQMLYLDDMPFFTPADSTSRLALVTEFNRFEDQKFGWSVNRLLVTMMLPAGEEAAFFVRMPFTSFDTGDVPLFSRWPWVQGISEEEGWPNGRRITSLGQPEIGVTGPTGLSFLPNWHYSAALGLPASTDRLYPFGSVSMPLRLELRKVIAWGSTKQIGLTMGYLENMDSAKDYLRGEMAFPSGVHLGGVLNWNRGRNSRLALSYDFHNREGRKSQLLGVQAWFPWTVNGSVGLKAARELQGSLDRPAAWYFTISFRLDSNKNRPLQEDLAPQIELPTEPAIEPPPTP